MNYSTGWGTPSGSGFWNTFKAPEPIQGSAGIGRSSSGGNSSPMGKTIRTGYGTVMGAGDLIVGIQHVGGFRAQSDGRVLVNLIYCITDTRLGGTFELISVRANEEFIIRNEAPIRTINSPYRFYGGDQTTPDPIITRYLPEADRTAWPGFCYIVFENFDIAPYDNEAPLFEFHVSSSVATVAATEEQSTLTFGAFDPSYSNNFITADPIKNQVYVFSWAGDDDGNVSVIDVATNREISRAHVTETNYSIIEYMVALWGTDYFVCTVYPTSSPRYYEIALVNAFTGEVVARTPAIVQGGSVFEMIPHSAVMLESTASTKFIVFTNPIFGFVEDASYLGALLVDVTNGTMEWIIHPWINPAPGSSNPYSIAAGPVADGECTFFYAEPFGSVVSVYAGAISAAGFSASLLYQENISGVPDLDYVGVAYDGVRNEVLVYWSRIFPSTVTGMRKLDVNGDVVWSVADPQAGFAINWSSSSYDHFTYFARPGYVIAIGGGASGDIYQIDLSDGSATQLVDQSQFSDQGFLGYFNQYTGEYVEESYDGPGLVNKITLGDATPGDVDLVDILTALATFDGRHAPEDLVFSGFASAVFGIDHAEDRPC